MNISSVQIHDSKGEYGGTANNKKQNKNTNTTNKAILTYTQIHTL